MIIILLAFLQQHQNLNLAATIGCGSSFRTYLVPIFRLLLSFEQEDLLPSCGVTAVFLERIFRLLQCRLRCCIHTIILYGLLFGNQGQSSIFNLELAGGIN